MKYRAVLPERNSNVTHEHPLREFLILLAGVVALVVVVYTVLGLLIDTAVDYISPDMELAIYQSVGIDPPGELDHTASGSETEQAAQKLLTELTQCIDIGYPVSLRVDESTELNAFASPGGLIVVLAGLLDHVESQNGLAFVLAHELAHFKNRDHLRSMGRGVVLVAVSVFVTGTNSDISRVVTPVSMLEVAQFSQERERAADATALQVLDCHYGHVGGATEFFELIANPDDDFDFALTHYFSSHPEAEDRIDAINALSKSMGYRTLH